MYVLLSSLGAPSLSPDGVIWGVARLLVEAVGVAFGLYVVAGILLVASAGPARRRARREERGSYDGAHRQTGLADPRPASVSGSAAAGIRTGD
jgi:hypothetical protein